METNYSILTQLCSQEYFEEVFSQTLFPLAFISIDLKLIWSNKSFENLNLSADSIKQTASSQSLNKTEPINLILNLNNTTLTLFPVIFSNQFLGYSAFTAGHSGSGIEIKTIKHDLNNLLTLVLNLFTTGQKGTSLTESLNITKDFLEGFKTGSALKLKQADIKRLLWDTADVYYNSYSGRIDIKTAINDDLACIYLNRGYLIRILSNLLTNAAEAIEKKGTIIISAFNTEISNTPFVQIEVKDNGPGINQNDLANIFNEDFSTKERGSGTGLATVKSLAGAMNGTIEVDSRPGKGTKFTLRFPSVTEKRKKIAIIEDEARINELLTDLLSFDYSTASFLNGEDFLSYEDIMDFDLAIIDKKLPGINGIDVLRKLKAESPRIKTILASGSEIDQDNEVSNAVPDGIIIKPYNFDQLLSLIEGLLD